MQTSISKTFAGILGHEEQKKYLLSNLLENNLSHAYLFVGESGLGKKKLVVDFIKTLLCQQKEFYCSKCPTCLAIEKLSHPDLFVAKSLSEDSLGKTSKSNLISINQIKGSGNQDDLSLIKHINLKPFSSDYKIALIDNAELLTEDAANTLLKTLEEPPGHSVIFLIAKDKSSLLETIVSRCRVIKFFRLKDDEIESLAKNHPDKDLIIDLSLGRPGFTLNIIDKNKDNLEVLKEGMEDMLNVFKKASSFLALNNSKKLQGLYDKEPDKVVQLLNVYLIIFRLILVNPDLALEKRYLKNSLSVNDFKNINIQKIHSLIKFLLWSKNTLSNPASGFNVKLILDILMLKIAAVKK